ncbi:MAG: pyroglutamyl-peptidase I [Clostridia bacterium]|nr:pyroglutamyl-peptidase I [Clostridia bacterium]
MKKLLISGFDPFGGEKINPSFEAVKLLPDVICEYELTKIELPTVFGRSAEIMSAKIEEIRPDAVICVGQAGGRRGITPEVIGINLREATIADNAGAQLQNEPVSEGAPDGIFSTLPVREMVAAIKAEGLPASLSFSAGAFVCNDLLFSLLNTYRGTEIKIGFIHVPFLPEQAKDGVPSMTLSEITKGLIAAIECL